MLKHLLIITGCLFSLAAHAQLPTIRATGKDTIAFVPRGWMIYRQAQGDLNKDSIADVALIIQNTDKANIKKHEGMGSPELNLNPRMLLVLFKEKDSSYRLIAKNSVFIPTEGSEESPCLSDPLMETEGVTINKGVLLLHYQYWFSCGSWNVTNDDYVFRYQNNQFELIGYESDDMHRSSGEMTNFSVNFSIGKWTRTTGNNMFEDPKEKPKTVTGRFAFAQLPQLDSITEEEVQILIEKITKTK